VYYDSTTLGGIRRMHVYTPPGYESGRERYPVLYLLHGAGDVDSSWSTVGRAGFILDNLIAANRAKPMIVVMPAGHVNGGGAALGAPAPATDGRGTPGPWHGAVASAALLALAALAVATSAAGRLAGVEGAALGAAQLVPTVALLLGAALAVEAALARASQPAPGAAAAIELLARPLPERYSAGLVLYGGGGPAALRTHLRREKLRAIVVEVSDADTPARVEARLSLLG
jgi:hypothetical protein